MVRDARLVILGNPFGKLFFVGKDKPVQTKGEIEMTRSRSVTIAAILLFVFNLWNAAEIVPRLAQGTAADSSTGSPPFAAALVVFTMGICGLFAAYGLWRNAKWGKVLGLVVTALNILYSMIPFLVAPFPIKLIAGGGIALNIISIVLLLRREARSVTV